MRLSRLAAGAAMLVAMSSACKVATVRPIGEEGGQTQEASSAGAPFHAVTFVDEIWGTQVLRALESAQDIAAIGHEVPAGDGKRAESIVVRGRGRVVDVDTRSRSGTARIELAGAAGSAVVIQVGPVLTGTAIRDAFPALGFDRFVNQIEHADVGNELNRRIEQGPLLELDRAQLRGREISFVGMASFEVGKPPLVTPVRLEVEARP